MTMLSIYLFALMVCGVLSENINCQFKPGCDVNHCDPSPSFWNKPGFSIDEYLQKKQFPITCEAQRKKSSDDVLRLYAENVDNRQEIKDLKQDVQNLVQEVSALKEKNKNAENGDATDIQNLIKKFSVLEKKNEKAENDVQNLVQEVLALKEKKNNAENGNATDIQNLVKKFSALEKKNEKAENDVRNLVKEVSALKEKNENSENEVRNLVQEVSDLKEKNENAENEIKKLRKKVDLMEATDTTTSKPVTTRRIVTTSETTTPETNADSLWYEGRRYFALASEEVRKATAEAKCQNVGGNLANLYSSAHMNRIIKYLRQQKLGGSSSKAFHLGMMYDPINKILRLRDGTKVSISDYKWLPGFPVNGPRWASRTNMVIMINSDPSYAYQYLYNYSDYNLYVLCEI